MEKRVTAWAEKITIPTYRIGKPDKNPMFLEKRVFQGSSGVVYPHPVIDRIYDEKLDQEYTALFLENQFLRIMVLPEIGGRVQSTLVRMQCLFQGVYLILIYCVHFSWTGSHIA